MSYSSVILREKNSSGDNICVDLIPFNESSGSTFTGATGTIFSYGTGHLSIGTTLPFINATTNGTTINSSVGSLLSTSSFPINPAVSSSGTAYSIEFWVKITNLLSSSNAIGLFSIGDPTNLVQNGEGLIIYINTNKQIVCSYVYPNISPFNIVSSLSPVLYNNRWTHVVFTSNGVKGTLYVNNILAGSMYPESLYSGTYDYAYNHGQFSLYTNAFIGSLNNLSIGTPLNAISGELANLGIYNDVLTPQQITRHYLLGTSPNSTYPVVQLLSDVGRSLSNASVTPATPSGFKATVMSYDPVMFFAFDSLDGTYYQDYAQSNKAYPIGTYTVDSIQGTKLHNGSILVNQGSPIIGLPSIPSIPINNAAYKAKERLFGLNSVDYNTLSFGICFKLDKGTAPSGLFSIGSRLDKNGKYRFNRSVNLFLQDSTTLILDTNGDGQIFGMAKALDDGLWHHIIVLFKHDTSNFYRYLYIDGVQIGPTAISSVNTFNGGQILGSSPIALPFSPINLDGASARLGLVDTYKMKGTIKYFYMTLNELTLTQVTASQALLAQTALQAEISDTQHGYSSASLVWPTSVPDYITAFLYSKPIGLWSFTEPDTSGALIDWSNAHKFKPVYQLPSTVSSESVVVTLADDPEFDDEVEADTTGSVTSVLGNTPVSNILSETVLLEPVDPHLFDTMTEATIEFSVYNNAAIQVNGDVIFDGPFGKLTAYNEPGPLGIFTFEYTLKDKVYISSTTFESESLTFGQVTGSFSNSDDRAPDGADHKYYRLEYAYWGWYYGALKIRTIIGTEDNNLPIGVPYIQLFMTMDFVFPSVFGIPGPPGDLPRRQQLTFTPKETGPFPSDDDPFNFVILTSAGHWLPGNTAYDPAGVQTVPFGLAIRSDRSFLPVKNAFRIWGASRDGIHVDGQVSSLWLGPFAIHDRFIADEDLEDHYTSLVFGGFPLNIYINDIQYGLSTGSLNGAALNEIVVIPRDIQFGLSSCSLLPHTPLIALPKPFVQIGTSSASLFHQVGIKTIQVGTSSAHVQLLIPLG